MNHKHSQTAILLFAQSAVVDAARKSLANVAVMDVLNDKILKTVQASGLDYYHLSENEQRGNSFATRFTNAVQDVFNLGYESVICLGNDTPLLTVNLIHQAARHLKNGNAVEGTSTDGGLYLIGLDKSQFNAKDFKKLPWQSRNLAHSFLKYIELLNSETVVLKTLEDIDSTADLHRFLAGKNAGEEIVSLLLKTLSRKRVIHNHRTPHFSQILYSQPSNKGSPYPQVA